MGRKNSAEYRKKKMPSDRKVDDKKLVKYGVIGATAMAICCFTPLLVISLGAIGLTAWLVWLDYFLLPALIFFIGLTGYGLWRLRSN